MEELNAFLEVPGTGGLCLHRGQDVVANRFPKLYGAASIQELCREIARAFTDYARVGRTVTQAWLQFESALLLILTEPPKSGLTAPEDGSLIGSPFLTFLITETGAARQIVGPARAFLLRQARVDAEVWIAYRTELLRLIGKVANHAQCEKLISRLLAAGGHSAAAGLPRSEFEAFGRKLIQEVPNRSRHAPLTAELENIVAKLNHRP